ncbi:Hypothetical predicted protein [Paramuricea clavata]|uniref:Uncharacterized protein n=1 Tax=Paramuricea clavata TaxID=317549 RepID=A0A7D9IQ51_PARCT|nr:Hypothetical predicted protein [Paramuricea clavata]
MRVLPFLLGKTKKQSKKARAEEQPAKETVLSDVIEIVPEGSTIEEVVEGGRRNHPRIHIKGDPIPERVVIAAERTVLFEVESRGMVEAMLALLATYYVICLSILKLIYIYKNAF